MSGIQIVGNANPSTAAEVEVNTKAQRITVRPIDYGSLGIYSIGGTSGTITAGTFSTNPNTPGFAFRNPTGSTAIALVKRVFLTAVGSSTGFTAGVGKAEMFVARSYTASEGATNATDITPAAASNTSKLRSNMATTQMVGTRDIAISSTAQMSGGTRTLDAQPIASIGFVCSATANTVMIPQASELFYQRVCEYPLVCAAQEGFLINFTTTATGTFIFSVSVHWEEVSSY